MIDVIMSQNNSLELLLFFFLLKSSLSEEYESLIYKYLKKKKNQCFALKERNSSQCITGAKDKKKHTWETYSHYYRM